VPPSTVLNDPSLVAPTIHLQDGVEDTLATELALKAISAMHPRLVLINYPEFDWPLGHVDGGGRDPAAVIADMRGFDHDLSMVEGAYRKAGILDRTLFVITADHGMMPITRFVPSSVITNAIARAGTTAPDIATNSGDFIWLADQSRAQAVAQNIVAVHDPGIQSVYFLSGTGSTMHYASATGLDLDTSLEAANEHLLATLMNSHEPTVVVFGKEGVSFSDPSTGWKGDHGGNSWQSQHIPLILAGPGIRPSVTVLAPAQLEDVAPTVLTALGVRPTGMQGTVLTDVLLARSTLGRHARESEDATLALVVTGLHNQSLQDLGNR
jgi:arylsulfatase A-like enzyme